MQNFDMLNLQTFSSAALISIKRMEKYFCYFLSMKYGGNT